MASPSVVLDLDTLANRPTVIIGGHEYRLFTVDLLPPLDNYRLRKLVKRGDELSLKDDLTEAELDELAGPVVKDDDGTPKTTPEGEKLRRGGLLDKIARIVIEAPIEVHEKLTDRQRVEIYQTFQVPSLHALLKLLPATAIPTEPTATGATSPPDSVASTQP